MSAFCFFSQSISEDEASHARVIAGILGSDAGPSSFKVAWTVFCARVFGITFTLKAMERGENTAGETYRRILQTYPQLAIIADDEERHEAELIDMLNDERLNNMGAIVLGLNDALVELTGALAGFTFAIGECSKIAKLGLITGLAAAMSMAASAFLSARADAQAGGENDAEDGGNAMKTATYTGLAYIITDGRPISRLAESLTRGAFLFKALGKGNVLADGKDVAIFATGIMNAADPIAMIDEMTK